MNINEIEARANAATKWDGWDSSSQGAHLGDTLIILDDTYEDYENDLEFIANARQDIPDLIARIRQLEEALKPFAELACENMINLYDKPCGECKVCAAVKALKGSK